MYDLELKKSHFPAQNDAEILNITVGELLKEVVAKSPTKTALVDILDNGACGQSWTYKEILEKAESLALSLSDKYKNRVFRLKYINDKAY
jgi:acyl-CoA synthetase (AMP-forming)/AMP-acid ligase II